MDICAIFSKNRTTDILGLFVQRFFYYFFFATCSARPKEATVHPLPSPERNIAGRAMCSAEFRSFELLRLLRPFSAGT